MVHERQQLCTREALRQQLLDLGLGLARGGTQQLLRVGLGQVRGQEDNPGQVQLPQVRRASDATARFTSGGSGFFVEPDCLVTCAHVISSKTRSIDFDKESIIVQGKEVPLAGAKIEFIKQGYNEPDVAVIRFPQAVVGRDETLKFALFPVERNAAVFIVGHPQIIHEQQVFSWGRVSDAARGFISTDAEGRNGNSGGPALNERGEVVGMFTSSTTSNFSESSALVASGRIRTVLNTPASGR